MPPIPARSRLRWGPIALAGAVGVLALTLSTAPTQAADPLPTLPLPTVPVPTVPVPTLPLPTVPVPTLPLPTDPLPTVPLPTVPLPTDPLPTLPLPTLPPPSVPVPTLPPVVSPSPPVSPPPPSGLLTASPPPGAGAGTGVGTSPGPLGSSDASPPSVGGTPVRSVAAADGDPTLGDLVLPGLLIGLPTIAVIAILAVQLATGASWVPVVRRWLDARQVREPVESGD